MTLMSLGLEDERPVADQGAAGDGIQATSRAQERMLDSWERQIAYCQKYRELLAKKDQQFIDDLSGREPTPSRIRYLNAITAAIQRDPCPASQTNGTNYLRRSWRQAAVRLRPTSKPAIA